MNVPKENFRILRKPPYKGPIRTSMLESQGPSGKIRGTVQQIVDRYLSMGRDALREGDGVIAESFFQHAEHYRRIMVSVVKRATHPEIVGQQEEPLDQEPQEIEDVEES